MTVAYLRLHEHNGNEDTTIDIYTVPACNSQQRQSIAAESFYQLGRQLPAPSIYFHCLYS